MTIPYDSTIPQPGDNPSISQGEFLTNFSGIDQWTNIDHYRFSSASPAAGLHKQVTFGANNPPSPFPSPVTVLPPVLFTNIQDGKGNNLPNGIPEIFLYSGSAAQGQNNYVSQGTGSVLLFGGIIMKWGQGSIPTGSNQNVPFTQGPFPNACFSVVVTGRNQGNSSVTYNVNGIDPGFFTLLANGANGNFYYVAIGN